METKQSHYITTWSLFLFFWVFWWPFSTLRGFCTANGILLCACSTRARAHTHTHTQTYTHTPWGVSAPWTASCPAPAPWTQTHRHPLSLTHIHTHTLRGFCPSNGVLPCASSIVVMPNDQMSALLSYPASCNINVFMYMHVCACVRVCMCVWEGGGVWVFV